MRRLYLPFILLSFLVVSPGRALPPVPWDPRPDNVTTVITRDAEGRLQPCRLEVINLRTQEPVLPVGPQRYYTTYFGNTYTHSYGAQLLRVENTVIRIKASSGPEITPQNISRWVGKNDTVNIVLDRAFDMRGDGWYGGDTHVHIKHGGTGDTFDLDPEDVHQIARAEDLAFTGVLSNGLFFTGNVDPVSDPDHLIYFGLEFRSGIYGHMGILGMPEIKSSWCCTPYEFPPYPSNSVSAKAYKQAGATVILAHPATTTVWQANTAQGYWPFSGFARELPALVMNGAVDAIDVFSYSNVNVDLPAALWFDILDLGVHLPLSAGTDAAVNRTYDPPPGGDRVYVRLDEPFTMGAWLEGLRAGRSFATNGPLVNHFSLNGIEPGGTVGASSGGLLEGSFSISSLDPIEAVELIANGAEVIASFSPPKNLFYRGPDTWEHDFSLSLPQGTSWVVLRAVVAKPGFQVVGYVSQAYTSPIYVKGLGRNQQAEAYAASMYVDWVDDLKTLALEMNAPFSPSGLDPLFTNLQVVKDKLLNIKRWEEPIPDLRQSAPRNQPVPKGTPFRFSAHGHGLGRVEIYDIQGRLVASLPRRELPARWTWSPGDRVASGVYFARITTPEEAVTRRLVILP